MKTWIKSLFVIRKNMMTFVDLAVDTVYELLGLPEHEDVSIREVRLHGSLQGLRAVTLLIAVLSGTPALAERHGYRGRSDLEVFAGRNIYIFEFKYNRSVREAMDQIHSRDYAGRYAMDSRHIYLIGANFREDPDNRRLEYEIEALA